MTKTEAKQQIEAFFHQLGEKASFFDEKNFVQARIGETVVGFEYIESEEILSAQALIYRFRSAPKDKVLDAIFAGANDSNTVGGRVVFDSETSTFYLQKDFSEKISDESFFRELKEIALAGVTWNNEILANAAETVSNE